MKKYSVSLAVKVPANFELEVNAKSKKHALQIALEGWDNGYDPDIPESFSGPLWEEAEMDIKITKDLDDLGNGICVDEISGK